MEKKNFWKMVFNAASVADIIRKIIFAFIVVSMAVSGSIPILSGMVRDIVKSEIEPINSYIFSEMQKLIEKNFDKILNDPGDIKMTDIETCLAHWEILKKKDLPDLPVLKQKINKILELYSTAIGKVYHFIILTCAGAQTPAFFFCIHFQAKSVQPFLHPANFRNSSNSRLFPTWNA